MKCLVVVGSGGVSRACRIITVGVIYSPGQWETRAVQSNDSHNLLIFYTKLSSLPSPPLLLISGRLGG